MQLNKQATLPVQLSDMIDCEDGMNECAVKTAAVVPAPRPGAGRAETA
jgi:hypothetical protein